MKAFLKHIRKTLMLGKLAALLARIIPARVRLVRSAICELPIIIALNRWLGKNKFRRHVMGNLVVGIIISVILGSLHGRPWLQEIEDDGIDWVMAMWRNTPPTPGIPSISYAFLDIDERTYQDWGEPLHIPRCKLLDLIKFAVAAKAALIVVDVDLSRPGQIPEEDVALSKYLSQYQDFSNPPIILARTFSTQVGGRHELFPRKSFLENCLRDASPPPKVYWASPLFEIDERDLRLRRWRLWENICDEEIIPSIELFAVALLKHPSMESCTVVQKSCQQLNGLIRMKSKRDENKEKINICGIDRDVSDEEIAQRIIYSIPWELREGEAYPYLHSDPETVMFTKRSARLITDRGAQSTHPTAGDRCQTQSRELDMGQLDMSWLAGRVAVIGASFQDTRDIYATPIGSMPGAMVIINAIHSLYQDGPIKRPSEYATISIEIALIILTSLAFSLFRSPRGMFICGTCIILTLVPASILVFKSGVWLDFTIPLVAVQWHHIYEEFKESRGK